MHEQLSAESTKKLLSRHKHSLILIVDERSMLDADQLAMMERRMKETIHFGKNIFPDEDWGGLPIVLLLGDDCQLPSITPGALASLDLQHREYSPNCLHGLQLFKKAGLFHMELSTVKRQDPNEKSFQCILDGLRSTGVNDNDAMFLHL